MEQIMASATLTVDQTAKILGIGRASAYEAVHQGQIPSLRIGNRILIPRSGLVDLLGEFDEPDASDR